MLRIMFSNIVHSCFKAHLSESREERSLFIGSILTNLPSRIRLISFAFKILEEQCPHKNQLYNKIQYVAFVVMSWTRGQWVI